MKKLNILFIIILIFPMCKENKSVKPMHYVKNGIKYNCDSYFNDDILSKVICFNNERDTVLIENINNGKPHGISKEFHSNGQVKNIGEYYLGAEKGIWQEFYSTGIIKRYSYFIVGNDSFNLIYQKNYDEMGEVQSLIYPIECKMNNDTFTKGDSVKLNISMRYSAYEDPLFIVFLENSMFKKQDTIITYDLNFHYKFRSEKKGNYTIHGTLFEYDGQIGTEGGFGGSRDFEVSYFVD